MQRDPTTIMIGQERRGEGGNVVLPLEAIQLKRVGHPEDDIIEEHFFQGEVRRDQLVGSRLQKLLDSEEDLADRFCLIDFAFEGRVFDQEVHEEAGEAQHDGEELQVGLPLEAERGDQELGDQNPAGVSQEGCRAPKVEVELLLSRVEEVAEQDLGERDGGLGHSHHEHADEDEGLAGLSREVGAQAQHREEDGVHDAREQEVPFDLPRQ